MRYIIYITACLFVGLASTNGQELLDMSHAEYQQLVLDNNLQIQSADSKVEASEYRIKANKKDFLPAISLDASNTYNNHNLTDGVDLGNGQQIALRENILGVNLKATQVIYAGGLVRKNVELAEIMNEAAQAGRALTVQEISFMSSLTYWRAVSAKEQLDAWYEYTILFEDFYKNIEAKVEDQLLAKNELLIAKVKFNDVKQQVLNAENQLEIAKYNLKKLAGLSSDATISTNDTIVILPTLTDNSNDYISSMDTRPEIQLLEKEVEANMQKEEIIKAPYLPSVGAQAQGSYGNGLLQGSDANMYYVVALKATIPITQWGKKKQEVNMQKMNTLSAEQQLEDEKINLEYAIKTSFYNVEQAVKQVNLANEAVDDAYSNLEVYLDRYDEGLSSIEAVTEAQTFYQEAIIKLYYQRLNYKFNLVEYKKATGQLL